MFHEWMRSLANGNFMRLRSSSAPVVRSSRDWGVVDTRHTLLMANKSSKILSAISSFDGRRIFYYFGFNKSDFCFYDRYYDFHVVIFSHSSSFSLLYFSPYPVRIIFLRSKIIIIAAPKVLMISETKRLKVMIRPRRRVSFTEVDIWIILIFFWHVRERDFRLRC